MAEFIYFIHPTRPDMVQQPTDAESSLLKAHFSYLKDLLDQGTVLLAGPSMEPPYTGIVVFKAPDRTAAQSIMDNDPAVHGGVFTARLSPFRCSLGPQST